MILDRNVPPSDCVSLNLKSELIGPGARLGQRYSIMDYFAAPAFCDLGPDIRGDERR